MDRPILFSTPMVQAILESRKTMTRRAIKPQPKAEHTYPYGFITGSSEKSDEGKFCWTVGEICDGTTSLAKCPYGKPGDILWVRETWCRVTRLNDCEGKHSNLCGGIDFWEYYKADGKALPDDFHWKPSIFMPREAARIFLKVKNVRIERLQDISEEDANAEGLYKGYQTSSKSSIATSAKQAFMWIWQKINGDESWLSNPWVWVVEFEKI